MTNQPFYNPIISDIQSVYENYSKDPSKVFEQKDQILLRINSLEKVGDKKECIGIMLLSCLEAFFLSSKQKCNQIDYPILKAKVLSHIHELLSLYPDATKIEKDIDSLSGQKHACSFFNKQTGDVL